MCVLYSLGYFEIYMQYFSVQNITHRGAIRCVCMSANVLMTSLFASCMLQSGFQLVCPKTIISNFYFSEDVV